jgi:hypothetical protein
MSKTERGCCSKGNQGVSPKVNSIRSILEASKTSCFRGIKIRPGKNLNSIGY